MLDYESFDVADDAEGDRRQGFAQGALSARIEGQVPQRDGCEIAVEFEVPMASRRAAGTDPQPVEQERGLGVGSGVEDEGGGEEEVRASPVGSTQK